MGMFDDVICEVELPDGKPNKCGFQTKDLDCQLDKYTITKDGRLTRARYRWNEAQNEYVPDGADVIQHHGYLNFYDYNSDTKEWREFNAKFTDGKLVEIVTVTKERYAPAPPKG